MDERVRGGERKSHRRLDNGRLFRKTNEIVRISFLADNGLYGETAYGDGALSQVVEPENVEPEKSDYESLITNAYNNLGSKINFAEFVGDDKWSIVHLPKSARIEPKSRIRKIIPGRKDDRADAKNQANRGKAPKSGFLTRIRTGVSSLVRDENNLLFGERSNYEAAYPEEDDEDGIDTDNLHREAQKLRELEDADKEINPEYIVIRNGKTIYGVHEADAEGKITLSTRKPIYDRAADQSVDPFDVGDRRTLLSRLRKPFNRNKDKDGKGENSPKSSTGTPDGNEKRRSKKSSKKTADEEMASKEPLEDWKAILSAVCILVYVCVCDGERERTREGESNAYNFAYFLFSVYVRSSSKYISWLFPRGKEGKEEKEGIPVSAVLACLLAVLGESVRVSGTRT